MKLNIKKIDKQLNNEMDVQMGILFPATMIALHRYFNWGSLKLEHFLDETHAALNECADYGIKTSIIQMLYEEVGINLKAEPNGKSWYEVCFLNNDVKLGNGEITEAQWYAMRVQQIKWCAPAILAAEFIALYRKFRFSRPMLNELMGYIDQVRKQYNKKSKVLSRVCYEETGIYIKGGEYRRDKATAQVALAPAT